MTDTPAHVRRLYIAYFKAKTVQERFKMGFDTMNSGRQMVECRLRECHPDWSEAELKAAVFERMYRNDFTADEMIRIKEFFLAPR